MTAVGAIVVFVMVWWLVFFAVLPWGVVAQFEEDDVEPGSEPGAPARPMLVKKALITTAIALVLSAVIYVVIGNELIDLGIIPQPSGEVD